MEKFITAARNVGADVQVLENLEELVAYIDEIADIFWQTDKAKQMGVYPPA